MLAGKRPARKRGEQSESTGPLVGGPCGLEITNGLASAEECCRQSLIWTPRWTMSDPWNTDQMNTGDIWSFAGTVGVTLLIMESGMHINFEKVKQIGGKALIVAIDEGSSDGGKA